MPDITGTSRGHHGVWHDRRHGVIFHIFTHKPGICAQNVKKPVYVCTQNMLISRENPGKTAEQTTAQTAARATKTATNTTSKKTAARAIIKTAPNPKPWSPEYHHPAVRQDQHSDKPIPKNLPTQERRLCNPETEIETETETQTR